MSRLPSQPGGAAVWLASGHAVCITKIVHQINSSNVY